MTETTEQTSEPCLVPIAEQSFFSTLLAPGSSLHPTLILLLDAAFGVLFLVFLSLAVATKGNVHLFVLITIELALWGSVRWFVHELREMQVQPGAETSDARSSKAKEE